MNRIKQNNIIPQTPEERLNYILKTLLIKKHSQNQANIYDFMNELYVSESTFRADCQKINNICEKYNCSLQISKDIVRINGSEKNKRKNSKTPILLMNLKIILGMNNF